MDLALLVYVISVLSSLGVISICLLLFSMAVLIFSIGSYIDGYSDKLFWGKAAKISLTVLIIFSTLFMFIPSEKTMYTMVGAYAAQKVAEDPKVQQLSGKVLKLVENRLDQYIDEATQSKK